MVIGEGNRGVKDGTDFRLGWKRHNVVYQRQIIGRIFWG